MDDKISASLILLTYKGKALLMHKQNGVLDEVDHPWCFIGGIKKRESCENELSKLVEEETGVKIENVECVSKSCYHARLTDDNVNHIQRAEHQLLNFFTLGEIKKLSLSDSTQQFIQKHSTLI